MTTDQAVARREDRAPVISTMWERKTHFAAILPDHIDVKSFLGTAAAALYAKPDLMRVAQDNPDSLIIALMECASLGHRPGTDEFYLLWRKIKGKAAVQGEEGYKGIIERMYRSGAVKKVNVREVCANDKFRYIEGIDDKPLHSTGGEGETGAAFFGANGSRNRGEMVGVYAYAELMTGAVSRVVLLSRADVMAARELSPSKDSAESAWNRLDGGQDHPEFKGRSMWWKTAARRLEPWVPTSAEYHREQLRAAASAVPPGTSAADAARAAQDRDAEIPQVTERDTRDSGPAPSGQPAGHEPAAGPDHAHDAEDTLPVEDPPDSEWPETVKPGTGTPRGK